MTTGIATQLKNSALCCGIEVLGESNVVKTFTSFYNHYRLDCVSVGSGMAVFESKCLENDKKKNIVFHLVDPDYLSFARARTPNLVKKEIEEVVSSFALKPDYPFVTDLVKAKGHLVSKSVMLLNWCNTGPDYYDYEAISILKPVAIFIVYSHAPDIVIGAAGSYKFHLFYNYIIGGKRACLPRHFLMSSQEEREIKMLASEYKLVHTCSSEVKFKDVPLIMRMSWLERKDRPIIFRVPELGHLPTVIVNEKTTLEPL